MRIDDKRRRQTIATVRCGEMDTDITRWLGQLGANGAIAAIAIYLYNKMAASHEKNWTEIVERWEKMSDDLHTLVRDNTAAFVRCTELIQGLKAQMDRWDGIERRQERRPRSVP